MSGPSAADFLSREREYERQLGLPEPLILAARAAASDLFGRAERVPALFLGQDDEAVQKARKARETRILEETALRQIGPEWLPVKDVKGPVLAYLRRYSAPPSPPSTPSHSSRPPVLLVHGASAWRGTFMEPSGGFLKHLLSAGYAVWTLDWRCSKSITDPWKGEPGKPRPAAEVPRGLVDMSLDDAADGELPAAVRRIYRDDGVAPLIVGHCMGAAITAMGIAKGSLTSERSKKPNDARIAERVILATIGLFYRAGVDSWFRANERLDGTEPTTSRWFLYPGEDSWADGEEPAPSQRNRSEGFEDMFTVWQKMPYRHCNVPFCQRISSLLGAPYRPDDIGYLHDTPSTDDPEEAIAGLAGQFGVMPLSFLYHCAQNVRRGWVAPMGGADSDTTYLQAEPFLAFQTTLITGGENQLWYRDSIDRMAEWLGRRVPSSGTTAPSVQKKVFERFGHQDLWWSERSGDRGSVYDFVTEQIKSWRLLEK